MELLHQKPTEGIATDAAHSVKNGVTQCRAVDLKTGKELFNYDLGNQTINIGEFLGLVYSVKYVIENDFMPPVIYTDSTTALAWYNSKSTASVKKNTDLKKAEIFLRAMYEKINHIKVYHWDNRKWGETPADFGNK